MVEEIDKAEYKYSTEGGLTITILFYYQNHKKLTPTEVIQLVKNSISLEAGLDYYLGISLANVRGRATKHITCPFHREKTASFAVTTEKNMFHCFGCGVKGDLITLVSLVKNIKQSRAAYIIAEDFGLLDKADIKIKTAKEKAADLEIEREFRKNEKELLYFLLNLKNTIKKSAKRKIKTPVDMDKFAKTYNELLPQLDMFIDCLETAKETPAETRVSNYYAAQEFIGKRIYPIYTSILEKLEKQGGELI